MNDKDRKDGTPEDGRNDEGLEGFNEMVSRVERLLASLVALSGSPEETPALRPEAEIFTLPRNPVTGLPVLPDDLNSIPLGAIPPLLSVLTERAMDALGEMNVDLAFVAAEMHRRLFDNGRVRVGAGDESPCACRKCTLAREAAMVAASPDARAAILKAMH